MNAPQSIECQVVVSYFAPAATVEPRTVDVLPRLKHALEVAPIDWSNPPELSTPQSNEV